MIEINLGRYASVFLVMVMTGAGPLSAQVLPQVNLPGRVPQGSPLPRVLPRPEPQVGPGLSEPALPGAAGIAPNRTVRVIGVTVAGATAYDEAALLALAPGLIGPAVPAARIEEARQAILSRYRQDGYVLTNVFANVDRAGNLRFTAVEGRIADVRLEGDIGPAGTQVLRFLKRLTTERPISAATLERYLLLASDVPGVTIHTVLRPSTDEPGTVTLIAQVSRKWYSGLIT